MELKLQNHRIGIRIGLALALPIAGLLALSLWILAGYHRTASDMRDLRDMAELAPVVSGLVHALQKERGISAGFVGSAGSGFSERLPAIYDETDEKRSEFIHSLNHFDFHRIGGNLEARVAAARESVSRLPEWRGTIAERGITAMELTGRYSGVISDLIGIIEEMLFVSTRADLTRTITTYTYLLKAKEHVGLERAVGVAGFAAGRFDAEIHARFIQLIYHQQHHLKGFRLFASAEQIEFFERTFYGVNEAEVLRMRRIAIKSRDTGSTGDIDAAHWYDALTRKIDAMKAVEDRVVSDLIGQASGIERSAANASFWISALALALLALTILLAAAIARGIIFPLERMTNAMGRLASMDKTAEIEGGDRGDEIGALARAALVFRENLLKIAQAEEQARHAAILSLYHQALSAIAQGVVITDPDGVILRINHAFTTMTGFSVEEAVGQKPSILKSGRHDQAFYAGMWRSLIETGGWSGEIWDRRKNGEVYPKWQTISAVKGPDGQTTHYVAAFSDITERKEAEEQIRNLAFYDPLTHLPNRRLLLHRLQQALALSDRNGRHGALLFIDLDNFKTLNDTLGHDMGDRLLEQVAGRLTGCMREGDTAARLGGDEFVIMLEDLSGDAAEAAAQAEIVGRKILALLNQPYLLDVHEHHSTPSIGVTLYRGHETGIDELMKQADMAMYRAKTSGRNTLRFFDPEMQATVMARSALEEDLRQGLREGQFLLVYQPQVDEQGRMMGAEALVRWHHPQRGMVLPAEFISVTEETGLILPLGFWVLETACTRLSAWARDPAMEGLTLAVNVSARQFRHQDFADQVLAILDHTGANPRRLNLELTESLFLDDVEDTIDKMNILKTRGVGFSLDDFGTGYSSLSHLKRLPLDQLKIDRSFIQGVSTDQNDAAITRTILALGRNLGLAVIAEGVETGAQLDFLVSHGCRAFQGYLFGRPGPEEALMPPYDFLR